MSISYQSKSDAVQNTCLSVQELTLKLTDTQVITASASTVTISLGETIKEIRTATFFDDSAATSAPVVASNRSVSGSSVTLTLSAAMAAADAIHISYVIDEQA
jgi:hypothetical protein